MIYAGVNGYLDPLPVDRVRAFEHGLLGLLRTQHAGILDAIRDTRDLDDATTGQLKRRWSNMPRRLLEPSVHLTWPVSRTRGFALPPPRRPTENHQGHADGRGFQAAARAGGGRGGAALCRAHGKGAGQHRRRCRRSKCCAAIIGRDRQRQRPSAPGLHGGARPVRPVQLGARAAGARAGERRRCGGQGGQVLLRRPQGLRSSCGGCTSSRSSSMSSCVRCARSASSMPRTSRTEILRLYDAGAFDVCTLIFSRFRSVMAQIPTATRIIPPEFEDADANEAGGASL